MKSALLLLIASFVMVVPGMPASLQTQSVPPSQPTSAAPSQDNPVSPPAPTSGRSQNSPPKIPIYRVPSDYAYFTAERKEMPVFPPEAAQKKIAGDVILLVAYSPEGNVEALERILGDPILVKAAIQAVTNWKFRPVKERGQKVRAVAYIGFHFVEGGGVRASLPFGSWEQKPPSASSAREGPGRVQVGSGVVAGYKLKGANPIYPDVAKQDRVQGTVELRGIIDKQGHISLLEVTKSPSLELAISSIEAVKTWEYKPYLLAAEPIEVETTITVNYTLR